MSVRRLAEPTKPSLLLLGEVSQSHPFMCNVCQPMQKYTTSQRRDMGGGEKWTAISMGQRRQAPQDKNSIQECQELHGLQTLGRNNTERC